MNIERTAGPRPVAARYAIALVAAGLLGVLNVTAAASESMPITELTPELIQVRDALAKYKDPFEAVRDGYFSTVGCVQYTGGDMGIHFINTALLGPEPDPMKPAILIYAPDADGGLELVAVEWFVPLSTGVKGRPSLFGQPFEGPMAGHEPLMPDELHHYDLHAWLFKHNPRGVFAHANPDLDCERGAGYAIREYPPRTVPHN